MIELIVLRTLACVCIGVIVLAFGKSSPVDATQGEVRFLKDHAFGSIYLYSNHHEPLLYGGFAVSNTNAVPSKAEEERIDRAARTNGIRVGRFHGGPSNVIDAAVLADASQRVVITMQNPKGSGGETLSIMRYTSVLPNSYRHDVYHA